MGAILSYHVQGNLDLIPTIKTTLIGIGCLIGCSCCVMAIGLGNEIMLLINGLLQGLLAWKLYPVYKMSASHSFGFPFLLCQQAMTISFITAVLQSIACARVILALVQKVHNDTYVPTILTFVLTGFMIYVSHLEWYLYKKHHDKLPVPEDINQTHQTNSGFTTRPSAPFFGTGVVGGNATPPAAPEPSAQLFLGEGHRLGEA